MLNFKTAMGSPVIVELDGVEYQLPRMRNRDWGTIAALLDNQRADVATKGMDPTERFKYLSIFTVAPVDFEDLRQYAKTPVGATRLIRDAFVKLAPETDDNAKAAMREKADTLLDAATPEQIELLSVELASLSSPKLPEPPKKTGDARTDSSTFATEGKKEEKGPSPLT